MTGIIVDQERCTRCSICAKICPIGLIISADETQLPVVNETNAPYCVNCGHCEIYCPAGALTLDFMPDDKTDETVESGEIAPDRLGIYMKRRRSVRHFTADEVEKDRIEQILDIVRYAPSGMNSQTVQWIVVHDKKNVHRLAELTIDWMRSLSESNNPLSNYAVRLVAAWECGVDPICRNAPHVLIAHIPEESLTAQTDAIIALAHFDIVASAFGLGTCWAGFVAAAARSWKPIQEALALPKGRAVAYAMMFGYPQYKIYGIPRRNQARITWQ